LFDDAGPEGRMRLSQSINLPFKQLANNC